MLNIQQDEDTNSVRATVYIPAGKESYFIQKVEDYSNEAKRTAKGNPKNNNLVASIEDVKLAMLDAFWIGNRDQMPSDIAIWCEIWLRYDYKKANCLDPREGFSFTEMFIFQRF